MRSSDLQPGTVLEHRTGARVTLATRKREDDEQRSPFPFHPGWWLEDGAGGLADFVLDAEDSEWEVAK